MSMLCQSVNQVYGEPDRFLSNLGAVSLLDFSPEVLDLYPC